MKRSTCWVVGSCLIPSLALAQPLLWSSDAGQINLDGSNSPMDEEFVFELGSFRDGFDPTVENIFAWEEEWVVADITGYNPDDSRFNRLYEVTSKPAPLNPGSEAWVMGKRIGATGTERLLFRAADWVWPTPNPLNPIAFQWNVKQATEVVAGQVNSDGAPFLMKSEETLSFDQWRALTLVGEDEDGEEDDPDKDGLVNLVEFVFGSSPTGASEAPTTPIRVVEEDEMAFLEMRVPRQRGREAQVLVEVSSDMTHWQSGAEFTSAVEGEPGWVRDLQPMPTDGGRRFMRVLVRLP